MENVNLPVAFAGMTKTQITIAADLIDKNGITSLEDLIIRVKTKTQSMRKGGKRYNRTKKHNKSKSNKQNRKI
jgi:hypothetical protein